MTKKFRVFHMSHLGKDLKVRSLCGRLRNEHKPTEIGLLGNWETPNGKVNCERCLSIGYYIGYKREVSDREYRSQGE